MPHSTAAAPALRYPLLDDLRGLTLLSMIGYHACWDLVHLFGAPWPWFLGTGAYLWQQSICWCFIFLSGFCVFLGHAPLRRGLVVFGAGVLVTAVTLAAMPDSAVLFGVLTLLGSATLLAVLLRPLLERIPAAAGLLGSLALFALTRNVNAGALGFGPWQLLALPAGLYRGWLSTYLGFPMAGFYSTDYFSLAPWCFLFFAGQFCFRLCRERGWLPTKKAPSRSPFAFLGRHSLGIYLLHQPVLYAVLLLAAGRPLL